MSYAFLKIGKHLNVVDIEMTISKLRDVSSGAHRGLTGKDVKSTATE